MQVNSRLFMVEDEGAQVWTGSKTWWRYIDTQFVYQSTRIQWCYVRCSSTLLAIVSMMIV